MPRKRPAQVGPTKPQLNFNDHCLLCLQPQPHATIEEILVMNPKELKSFQPVLHYLTGTDHDKGEEESIPQMDTVPPLCWTCYDISAKLYQLHEQLLGTMRQIQRLTEGARKVVTKTLLPNPSQPSPRSQFYEKIKTCGMPEEEVEAVTKFVASLHEKVFTGITEKRKARLPTSILPVSLSTPRARLNVCATPRLKLKPNQKFTGAPATALPTSSSVSANVSRPVTVNAPMSKSTPVPVEIIEISDSDEEELVPLPPPPSSTAHIHPPTSLLGSSELIILPPAGHSSEIKYEDEGAEETPINVEVEELKLEVDMDDTDNEKNDKVLESKSKKSRGGLLTKTTQKCDLCEKRIYKADMFQHMTSHVQDFVTKCRNPSCPMVFSCRRKMERHILSATRCRQVLNLPAGEGFTKNCETCNFSTKGRTAASFLRHVQSHEYSLPEKNFSCPIPGCSERFALRQSVDEHIFTHDLRPEKTGQNCPLCRELFKVQDMAQHLRDSHQVEEVIPCQRCPFQFHSRELLLDHLSDHFAIGLPCYLCVDKTIKFQRYESLRQHYFNVHQIGNRFICLHCDTFFFAQSSLNTHFRSNHSSFTEGRRKSQANIQFNCNLCQYSNSGYDQFRFHKFSVHGLGENPLICRYCSKPFPNVSYWKKHEAAHLGLERRVYKCPVPDCGKKCGSLSTLIRHKLVHSNSRLFLCDLCPHRSNNAQALKAHKLKVHDVRGWKRPSISICDTCGESFSSPSSLKRHKLIHTGQRPYSCPLCGQRFRHTSVMQKHIKSHEEKGADFKPTGASYKIRKRVVVVRKKRKDEAD